ncbi:HesA/MoeB/ThiF family protein [Anoxynatronum buryatiense]|uniref:Molybdopterin or thiamine biosynthesis adenylyltransferase n=1 Tax=Anoxynatronum buryatiense TaxID=489973 RepID=A0AA46AJZ2_9CLOT|nr:HesA/MoeB/ThiF family protein [Anoxynatronum buryatiense]SMP64982.1 Molybdopterin or thiamine biosynthesis adenylyltransferase [Anoxynatronum buryatiense]
MVDEARYSRNMKMLSPEENGRLRQTCVAVVGCGGLGGGIIEMLGRLGIGKMIAVDGDVFEPSNLNRQLLSHTRNMGQGKAEAAVERMALVNPDVEVKAVQQLLTAENAPELLAGAQVIVDAVDRIGTRLMLQQVAEAMALPLVHGAIGGWYGQVTTILPGDKTLDVIYAGADNQGIERDLGNPSFTPALVGAAQVSEVLKLLINRGTLLRHRMLYIDLFEQEYTVLNLGEAPDAGDSKK